MAITWNMNFADLAMADFQDKAFVQMFIDALTERGFDMSGYVATKGFNLQDKSFWDFMQAYLDTLPTSVGGTWLRREANLTGVATNNQGPSLTFNYFVSTLSFFNASDPTSKNWPASDEKEFATFSSIADTHSGDFKNGAYYRKLDNGFIYQRITADVTIHDSSGWSKSTQVVGTTRNLLTDNVDIYFGNHNFEANSGDYIFTSFVTGIRDAVNAFVVTHAPIHAAGSPAWSAQGVANDKTGVDPASYAAAAATTVDDYPIAVYLPTPLIHRRRAQLVIPTPADGLTPTLQIYAHGIAPSGGTGTFDANGDTVGNRTVALVDTQNADGAGTTIISVMVGTLTQPNGPPGANGKGYDANTDLSSAGVGPVNGLVAWRYDVAGGFVYRP